MIDGPGMASRRVRIAREDVARLRWILEAYDGLANVYGEGDGSVLIVTPESRAAELDALLTELRQEIASLERA